MGLAVTCITARMLCRCLLPSPSVSDSHSVGTPWWMHCSFFFSCNWCVQHTQAPLLLAARSCCKYAGDSLGALIARLARGEGAPAATAGHAPEVVCPAANCNGCSSRMCGGDVRQTRCAVCLAHTPLVFFTRRRQPQPGVVQSASSQS